MVISLGEMLNSVAALPPEAFHRYAFAGEARAGKIPPADRLLMAEKAARRGAEEARLLAEGCRNSPPALLCRRLGIGIECTEEEPDRFLPAFAWFAPPGTITILSRYARKAQELADKAAFESRVEDTLIAHELFHFTEDRNRRNARGLKPELWGKAFSGPSPLPCLSEIAAMAFARELLGLPYSPYTLNIALMHSIDPGGTAKLFRAFMEG
ncbi:MAG: hypothetical protein LBH15_08965 [Treponema sp.]|jgi:hypothetical protein|nr:hypothetical protein [Treponema sp.]